MRALLLKKENEEFFSEISDVKFQGCDDDINLNVKYSSLNYKDALAICNKSPVVRSWPMVAGIDGAGSVTEDKGNRFPAGSDAVVTGWGLGETRWGCLAERVSVKPHWPTALSEGLTAKDAMRVGTAGLTAMLCIMAIERGGVKPGDGPILVTGASGGVGGMALMFLKSVGYQTVASSGSSQDTEYFSAFGVSEIIDRSELSEPSKPLQKERWAAVIDSVGSHTLVNACAQTQYGGVVAACGLAQGMDFDATVAPFILRGITLAGVDSVMASADQRAIAWDRISKAYVPDLIEKMTQEIGLSDAIDAAHDLLAGKIRGRLVVDVRR